MKFLYETTPEEDAGLQFATDTENARRAALLEPLDAIKPEQYLRERVAGCLASYTLQAEEAIIAVAADAYRKADAETRSKTRDALVSAGLIAAEKKT